MRHGDEKTKHTENDVEDGKWMLGLVIQGVRFVLSTKLHTCLNPAS